MTININFQVERTTKVYDSEHIIQTKDEHIITKSKLKRQKLQELFGGGKLGEKKSGSLSNFVSLMMQLNTTNKIMEAKTICRASIKIYIYTNEMM